jgi:hypothetical protein
MTEKLEPGFCDTCKSFVVGANDKGRGKCRRYPSVQEITNANMNWCGEWAEGKQRVIRSSSSNPDGVALTNEAAKQPVAKPENKQVKR